MFAAQHGILNHELLAALAEARTQTDKLFALVKNDFLYERPIPERHRVVFYIGHLEAFDWNLLQGFIPQLQSFHPKFDRLFAFGIDPVDGGLPSDEPKDWPALAEVHRYRSRVRDLLDEVLESSAFWRSSYDGFSAATLLNVAVEHRLMHAETLAYMFHQLPLEQKIRQGSAPAHTVQPLEFGMVEIPAGRATLGLSRGESAFGWDNEFDAHEVRVPAFAIDRYKVTASTLNLSMRAATKTATSGRTRAGAGKSSRTWPILCSGSGGMAAGTTAPCSTNSHCHSTGLYS